MLKLQHFALLSSLIQLETFYMVLPQRAASADAVHRRDGSESVASMEDDVEMCLLLSRVW
jgi:hypothetical protein